MQYTSGTTGRPKGVRRPLVDADPDEMGGLYTGFLQMFGITPHDDNVHLVVSPLYHTAVLVFTASSMHLGHTVVLMDKWTPEGTLERIERYRVTTSHMVPTQFHRLLALPEEVRASYDVSSLRHMIHAAAPCPPEIKRRMLDWWGPVIDEYYAATEGGGTHRRPRRVARAARHGGQGVADVGDRDLRRRGQRAPARRDRHRLHADVDRASSSTTRTRRRPRPTACDGFFTVGDIGYLDEDGCLFLRDRKSDMIISGGVNIYPAEIEGELLTHPKVGDAAVFGIPHDDWGEEVKAVVEPADGVEPGAGARAEELRAHLRDRLAELQGAPLHRLHRRRCRATPTASSTSGGCATPTGPAASAPFERRLAPRGRTRRLRSSPTRRRRAGGRPSTSWPRPPAARGGGGPARRGRGRRRRARRAASREVRDAGRRGSPPRPSLRRHGGAGAVAVPRRRPDRAQRRQRALQPAGARRCGCGSTATAPAAPPSGPTPTRARPGACTAGSWPPPSTTCSGAPRWRRARPASPAR